ncbi:SGNH/GDSL hydrolase family protein [Dyadobacter sp. CY347]|uniref:SGNH/GDSL hydrolase family protein n=1 Tax=Dyadobacter sp. CY347 TaxID=2909336 RepID=UPI001F2258A5|nr:SGNH/GDSL hydrolase family protein [Dyadobacter sp. CY347]MCF2487463.1 SGNH/GDSL hydrolase family protein [Dyadobacter sp. CY347]
MPNTSQYRQKINSDLTSNNSKSISASKLRAVLETGAGVIDDIYNNLSLADRLGTFNAATSAYVISETGATGTLVEAPAFGKGKYFDCDTQGTNSLTGVSKSWGNGDKIISAATKWDRIPFASAITDPKQSPNLINFANQNPENWSLGSTGSSLAPRFYRASGTAVVSIEKNIKGIGFFGKAITQPSARINFLSNTIPLDLLPASSKVAIGYYLYLKPGTILGGSTQTLLLKVPEGTGQTVATEMINLGNGLYYVRSTASITVAAYTDRIQLAVYLYTDAASPADSEIWLGSPTLLKMDTVLTPQMYLGADYISLARTESTISEKINTNALLDVSFRKQVLGATSLLAPWTFTASGTPPNTPASFIIESTPDGPIGSKSIKATLFKNGSNSNISDFQLVQRIAIPATYVGMSKLSFSVWIKRTSLSINIADAPILFYDAVTGGASTSVPTPPTIIPQALNEWVCVKFENISVPANALSVAIRFRATCSPNAVADTNFFLWLQAPQLAFGSPIANAINVGIADEAEVLVTNKLAASFGVPLLPNGDFTNGVISHTIVTASTFLPEFAVVDQASTVGTKALKVSNIKRLSDSAQSILRDYITMNVVAGANATISFSFLFKGNLAFIKPYCQIEFRNEGGSVSTYIGLDTSYIDLGDGWLRFYAQGIAIPATATILRCGIRLDTRSTAVAGNIYESFHTGHMAAFGSSIVEFSKTTYQTIASQLGNDTNFAGAISMLVNPVNYFGLQGIKMCFFGDSIIQANVNSANAITTNYEVDLLVKRFGIVPYVRGTGGSQVVDNGQIAWYKQDADPALDGLYLARPDDGGVEPVTPHYTFSAAGSTAQRVSTIPTSSQIVFIRFGTNDYIKYPLGDIYSPQDQTTFCGAYRLMLSLIHARVPNAIIILATPLHRNGEDTAIGTGIAAGVRFEQVRDAIRSIAKIEKCLLCETSESGVSQRNHANFLSDGIHPNAAGYGKISIPAINTLKKVYGL